MLCLGRSQGQNPRGRRPQGLWHYTRLGRRILVELNPNILVRDAIRMYSIHCVSTMYSVNCTLCTLCDSRFPCDTGVTPACGAASCRVTLATVVIRTARHYGGTL